MILYKQVIVVRTDLEMGKGKIAAQVAHAAVNAVVKVLTGEHRVWFDSWFADSYSYKIVLKVNTLDELTDIKKHAEEIGLPVVQMKDKGLTQIPEGTITCIGIGPAPVDLIDKVTSNLKLL